MGAELFSPAVTRQNDTCRSPVACWENPTLAHTLTPGAILRVHVDCSGIEEVKNHTDTRWALATPHKKAWAGTESRAFALCVFYL